MMAEYSTSVRLQKLLSAPYTVHADWRPGAPHQNAAQKQMLEIASADHTPLSICAQQHQCTSSPIPSDSVMLTTSTCTILHVSAGDQVRVAPITLHKAFVKEDLQIPRNDSMPSGMISSALAKLLGTASKDHLDLVLCPSSYTATRQNMQVHILDVKEEQQPANLMQISSQQIGGAENTDQNAALTQAESQAAGNGEKDNQSIGDVKDDQSILNIIADSQNTSLPCIWLRPDVIAALDLKATGEVFLYESPLSSMHVLVRVLMHPGFCYLSSTEATAMNIQDEAVIELHGKKETTSYAQFHPLPEDIHESSVDFTFADALHIEKHHISLTPIHAQLYWVAKATVDDVRNKARAGIGLPQEALTHGGYALQEPVFVFHGGKRHVAIIEPLMKPLPEGMLAATPLLLRHTQLGHGQGVFLSIDHIPFAIAKVGVLNVDELGDPCAKGSDTLTTIFKMPCWVELQNPQRGTSLDILLQRDPYPRMNAMVRLARTTRQMLLVERGDEVVVRPIIPAKDPRPIRTFLFRALNAPIYRLLLILIKRRRIHVSLAPGHTWDDQAQVARIDVEALTVLGISQGDHIRITYRGKSISRIALARDTNYKDPVTTPGAENAVFNLVPLPFQMGLDALGRYKLGGGELDFGTIVEIERDMGFVLLKSLNLALLPLIGTILTLITFFSKEPLVVQIIITIILGCLFFYFALSTERSKVA
jgi:hypothetical protein